MSIILNLLLLLPKTWLSSSPSDRTLILQLCVISNIEKIIFIGLTIITSFQVELLKLPKVQNTIDCNCCSSEKYCNNETKEEKNADMITPDKTNIIVLLEENNLETINTNNTATTPKIKEKD